MKIENSNLWLANADIHVVTTNSYVKMNGELVMGRGAALELWTMCPWIAKMAGSKIKNSCGHLGIYGFMEFGAYGLFQVKTHFDNKADLNIIRQSSIRLANFCYMRKLKFGKRLNIHMNFPAIGNGKLDRKDVEPILRHILPDGVTLHVQE